MNALDRAVAGACGGALSVEQKKQVCARAWDAWVALGEPGFGEEGPEIVPSLRLRRQEAFALWRQHEQLEVCGVRHLTACEQRHFAALMAHFTLLLAEAEEATGSLSAAARLASEAEQWWARSASNGARLALAKLRTEMRRAAGTLGDAEAYVARIAGCRFKTSRLATLSERQLWTLVFDVRRAAARRRESDNGKAVEA